MHHLGDDVLGRFADTSGLARHRYMHSCAVLVISSDDQVERKMSDSATDYSSPEEDISSSSSDYDYNSSEESSPKSDDENERDKVGELRGVDPYRF